MALNAALARAAAPLLLRARLAPCSPPALSRRRLLSCSPTAGELSPPARPPASKLADPPGAEAESPLPWRAAQAEILRDVDPVVQLIKDILHSDRYGDGECLSPKDENIIVEKLLAYHPRAEDKIGCGLDAIMGGGGCGSDGGCSLRRDDAAAAIDPLYMTESAGTVSEEGGGDESFDEPRDVFQEGGDAAAATDPLYVTESAGTVSAEGCNDESTEEARGLDGGDSGDKLEADAGASTGKAERKPVPVGDVAVAGEVVEVPGSSTTEHAGAESSELEENYVNATPVVANRGKDNGVAHCDEEIQNGPANFAVC